MPVRCMCRSLSTPWWRQPWAKPDKPVIRTEFTKLENARYPAMTVCLLNEPGREEE